MVVLLLAAASAAAEHHQHHPQNDQAAQAAASLQLLLREDPGLQEHGLTENTNNTDGVAFPYAAALLSAEASSTTPQQRASVAVTDVERKLALVESLAVKLSRTSPEAVAGHLLKLHGYQQHSTSSSATTGTAEDPSTTTDSSVVEAPTLQQIRERAVRLERQAETVESTARRVETSLNKGLTKMKAATLQLSRVLTISSTLKTILRLQFETTKLLSYDLEDLRDLTRAAASVSVVEELWASPELNNHNHRDPIAIVESMRPAAERTAQQVRQAAAQLLANGVGGGQQQHLSVQQLGAVLQVYFHLGELPTAVWQAVDHAHQTAERVTRQLWNPVTLTHLEDQVFKKKKDSRDAVKKWKEVRTEAAREWATGVLQAAQRVSTLNRVLTRKTDAVTRRVFVDVVAAAPVPTPYAAAAASDEQQPFSLLGLFWGRLCQSLADIVQNVLEHDRGSMVDDVAALYPAVRAAAIEMVSHLQESSSHLSVSSSLAGDGGEGGGGGAAGILGGSAALEDPFLDWHDGATGANTTAASSSSNDNPQAAASADSWTITTNADVGNNRSSQHLSQRFLAPTTVNLSAVIHSSEWKTLQGRDGKGGGLYLLEQAFLAACQDRLTKPLQYMFPENIAIDDDGLPISTGLALLPSKYDVQRFDENIRQELSTADPREGAGDLSAVTMIADCVVKMISEFCVRAKNAMSGVGEHGYLNESDWSMTDSLQHDRKVVAILYTLKNYLKKAPEKTFVEPYRPAVLPQNVEAANLCAESLEQACIAIDNTVKQTVLLPLCRTLNRHIAMILAKMHYGVYVDHHRAGEEDEDASSGPSFVQKELTGVFETIAQNHIAKFPPVYASEIASNVVAYTIYNFLSNASLVRPLGESARLHITQDLADLEMILEQLVVKTGGSLSLHSIENGKPYAELRAVRQMLFWSGLDHKSKSADDVAKSLMREVWMKDVRPSTVFHYLFSYGPSLLSSPYHAKRMTASEYVNTLVQLDGSVVAGEDANWMIVMSCCDSYQQRASAGSAAAADGDTRVAQIVMSLGQELLRRRGRN